MIEMLMPLGQMNSTTAPAGGATTAAPGPVPPPGVPVAPVVEVPATGPAGQAVMGAGPATTQATSQPGTPIAKDQVPPAPWYSSFLGMAPIILMLVALYFFMMRGQKKEEKRRKTLLSEMKKGDKVQTIGGLVAKIVSIDGDEVVLKVDESANVKATYKKSAIANVIVSGDEKTK